MTQARPVVLVTGAARRIGRAIALELAAHGYDLALHVRTPSDDAAATMCEAQALGARASCVCADLAVTEASARLLHDAAQTLGRVDHVVNNASLYDYDHAREATPASMQLHFAVNTIAPVSLAQALDAHLGARGVEVGCSPCVVNVLDQKLWNPNPDYFAYTLSKAALREATRLLAQALAPRLRVVGVAPGTTLPSAGMSAAEFERARQMTPLQRNATPQDLARACRFAIESPALTGSTLLIDAGQHLAAQSRDVWFAAAQQAPQGWPS